MRWKGGEYICVWIENVPREKGERNDKDRTSYIFLYGRSPVFVDPVPIGRNFKIKWKVLV